MRYTAEAIMDEKGLRDVERWKDKIEVRLDNRQNLFTEDSFVGSGIGSGESATRRQHQRGRPLSNHAKILPKRPTPGTNARAPYV